MIRLAFVTLAVNLSYSALADDNSAYKAIAKQYGEQSLSSTQVSNAKMQGECLVALKALTFRKKSKFDPIAEWTNYRAISLLEQYSPCEVLIMLEVATSKIRQQNNEAANAKSKIEPQQ